MDTEIESMLMNEVFTRTSAPGVVLFQGQNFNIRTAKEIIRRLFEVLKEKPELVDLLFRQSPVVDSKIDELIELCDRAV